VRTLETADGLKNMDRELIFRSLPLFSFCYKSGVKLERALRSWILGGYACSQCYVYCDLSWYYKVMNFNRLGRWH
jgi:hypothetical protein